MNHNIKSAAMGQMDAGSQRSRDQEKRKRRKERKKLPLFGDVSTGKLRNDYQCCAGGKEYESSTKASYACHA